MISFKSLLFILKSGVAIPLYRDGNTVVLLYIMYVGYRTIIMFI